MSERLREYQEATQQEIEVPSGTKFLVSAPLPEAFAEAIIILEEADPELTFKTPKEQLQVVKVLAKLRDALLPTCLVKEEDKKMISKIVAGDCLTLVTELLVMGGLTAEGAAKREKFPNK